MMTKKPCKVDASLTEYFTIVKYRKNSLNRKGMIQTDRLGQNKCIIEQKTQTKKAWKWHPF